mgnify:CR=1 FL=1
MLPREKYLQKGLTNLSDMELIAILVGKGVKGRNFLDVSKSVLLQMKRVVQKKTEIDIKDIVGVEGIGLVTAMRILSGIELGRRLYEVDSGEKIFLKTSNDAYTLLRDISRRKQEHVVALFLNSRFELLARRTICIGSLDGVSVLPRDIIIPALEVNASSVVLAHNHPSGDPTPSSDDIVITKRISEGLSLVGLNLLDHIVIGEKGWERVDLS